MNPLAITPGDPGGIGPDLCIQAAIDGELEGVVIADPEIMKRRADILGLPVSIVDANYYNPDRTQGVIYVDAVAAADPTNEPGVSDPDKRWLLLCSRLNMPSPAFNSTLPCA